MTDQLYNKTREIVNALLSANADAVSKELADSPEGKLAVSIGCKLRFHRYRCINNRKNCNTSTGSNRNLDRADIRINISTVFSISSR